MVPHIAEVLTSHCHPLYAVLECSPRFPALQVSEAALLEILFYFPTACAVR